MRMFEEVAVNFASALVAGEFDRAATFLAPALGAELPAAALRDRFVAMFSGYAHGRATGIQFDDEFSLVEWPAKQPGDVGWVYVGIEAEDFLEAVSVTVADVDGMHLIRDIEWGRP
jgi:hypothetical protein